VWQDWDGNSPLPTGVICVVCSDVCWDIICVRLVRKLKLRS
jgi:hypothetical protein